MFIRLATDCISPDKEKFQLGGNAVAHCIKAVEGDESCISARGKLQVRVNHLISFDLAYGPVRAIHLQQQLS